MQILLGASPQLVDFEPLRELTAIEVQLALAEGPIQNLDFLENLRDAEGATLSLGSDTLVDVTALRGLRSVGSLTLGGQALEAVPDFDELTSLGGFALHASPRLRAAPSFPLITRVQGDVSITGNTSLSALTGFANLESAQSVYVVGNTSLSVLDLGRLREVPWHLEIFGNGRLDGAVVDATLAPIQSYLRRISPDQTASTHAPCPWVDDEFCDEDFFTSGMGVPLCAPGTDPVCLEPR